MARSAYIKKCSWHNQININCCKVIFIKSNLLISPKGTFNGVFAMSTFWERTKNKLFNKSLIVLKSYKYSKYTISLGLDMNGTNRVQNDGKYISLES